MFPLSLVALPNGRLLTGITFLAFSDDYHHSLKDFLNRLARRIDDDGVLAAAKANQGASCRAVALGDVNESLFIVSRRIGVHALRPGVVPLFLRGRSKKNLTAAAGKTTVPMSDRS